MRQIIEIYRPERRKMKKIVLGAHIGNSRVQIAPIKRRATIVFRRPTTSKTTPLSSKHGMHKNEEIVAAVTFNEFASVYVKPNFFTSICGTS
jgi:hypothetical protein